MDSEQHFKNYMQKRGCRFYCYSNNAMVYSMNYQFTNMFCEREKDDNIYCNQIIETVNKCGEDNIAALTGCLGYVWSTFIAPIWSILSKPLPVKNIKAVVEKAQSMQLSRPATVVEDLKGIVGVIVILILVPLVALVPMPLVIQVLVLLVALVPVPLVIQMLVLLVTLVPVSLVIQVLVPLVTLVPVPLLIQVLVPLVALVPVPLLTSVMSLII